MNYSIFASSLGILFCLQTCASKGRHMAESENSSTITEKEEEVPVDVVTPIDSPNVLHLLPNSPTGYVAFSANSILKFKYGAVKISLFLKNKKSSQRYRLVFDPSKLAPICSKTLCPVIFPLPVGSYTLVKSQVDVPKMTEKEVTVSAQSVDLSVERYLPPFALAEDELLHLGLVVFRFQAEVFQDGTHKIDTQSTVRPMEPTRVVWDKFVDVLTQLKGKFLIKNSSGKFVFVNLNWRKIPKQLPEELISPQVSFESQNSKATSSESESGAP